MQKKLPMLCKHILKKNLVLFVKTLQALKNKLMLMLQQLAELTGIRSEFSKRYLLLRLLLLRNQGLSDQLTEQISVLR